VEKENGIEFWTEFPSAMKALSTSYYAGCRYKHGCYKSPAFNSPDTMPPSYAKLFKEYKEKYDIYDVQLFTSISSSYGIGWHTDPDNVLITAVYGEPSYQLLDDNYTITLKQGQTLFIPKGKEHFGMSSLYPRVVFSCATPMDLTEDDVDFHYSKITGDYS